MDNIIIYSTPDCPYCTMAKEFLAVKGISFTERDVAHDQEARQEMIEKSGQMSVPVIVVGEQTFIGFDQAKIEKLLH